ncbi:MAG TPA: choice-of-anchor Q domain-containing protein [Thermoleophilaceae bacterium]
MTRPLAALALLVPLVLAAPAAAQVTNTNDSGPGSLRVTLEGAAAGDTIVVPAGTYNLTSGSLTVAAGVTLDGDAAGTTVIRAAGAFRVLCVTTTDPTVGIVDLTIAGGRASPGDACANGRGGGIANVGGALLNVVNSVIAGNTSTPGVSGGGGGIYTNGDVSMFDSVIRNNATNARVGGNNGGGGIYWDGTGNFSLNESTISGNTATVAGGASGGGGIYSNAALNLQNVTVSGNTQSGFSVGGGGGGIFKESNTAGLFDSVTFFGNHSDVAGGAVAGAETGLLNSILDRNTAPTGPGCGPGSVTSQGGNVEFPGASCSIGANDRVGADPQLGPLAVNGAPNGTLTHAILTRNSPAVDFPQPANCVQSADQRGVGRSFGTCDSGAYEFDGKTTASVPDCSPNGVIPLALDEPPGGDVIGLRYRVNGGGLIEKDTGDAGDAPTPTSVTLPEGRDTLEYFGQWTNGVESGHGFSNVLVDKTDPTLSVTNNNLFSVFVIKRKPTVNVQAADNLSGLVQNPSGARVPLDTSRRGATTFAPTAKDLCQHTATAPFPYRVLAPGLGIRTVLERVTGRVRVRRPGSASGAQASQKGIAFQALTQPRELPIRSLVDARSGTARLTTARTTDEANIQDGEFSKGVFQVLQRRKKRDKGLTTLQMKGGNFSRCLHRSGKGASAAKLRKPIRRLRANAHGRFRTRGRHSAATVRGTIFTVTDRCDGTLTTVKRGRVAVRDFRRKKTIIVRAGKSYLARARR